MNCPFVLAWVGPCGKPAADRPVYGLPPTPFCVDHLDKQCSKCSEQANRECDATVGPFVCGEPLCAKHCHDWSRR